MDTKTDTRAKVVKSDEDWRGRDLLVGWMREAVRLLRGAPVLLGNEIRVGHRLAELLRAG